MKLVCGKCGAPTELKTGQYGAFFGCSAYPKCTEGGTLNAEVFKRYTEAREKRNKKKILEHDPGPDGYRNCLKKRAVKVKQKIEIKIEIEKRKEEDDKTEEPVVSIDEIKKSLKYPEIYKDVIRDEPPAYYDPKVVTVMIDPEAPIEDVYFNKDTMEALSLKLDESQTAIRNHLNSFKRGTPLREAVPSIRTRCWFKLYPDGRVEGPLSSLEDREPFW